MGSAADDPTWKNTCIISRGSRRVEACHHEIRKNVVLATEPSIIPRTPPANRWRGAALHPVSGGYALPSLGSPVIRLGRFLQSPVGISWLCLWRRHQLHSQVNSGRRV